MSYEMIHSHVFKVIEDSRFGKGCIATKTIKKGEIICKMQGSPISYKQFCEKYGPECDDLLQIGEENFIELMKPYVFFNHSCDPNAGLRNKGILFAIKNISRGEEIFYDYSSTADDLLWQMNCSCNSKKCRKKVGDFQSLPHETKTFFLKEGALMDYLLNIYY